jgi:hypothetical protein
MTHQSQRRALIRHGCIFLFVALCLGIAVATLPHPRAWLAAHLTAFLTGLIFIAVGLIWSELRLTDGQRRIGFSAAFLGAYVGLTANIFGAIVDLPGPASHPGVMPPMPQAAVFFSMLAVIVTSLFTAVGLLVYGMRGNEK